MKPGQLKKMDYYEKEIEQERKIQDLSRKINRIEKVLEQMSEQERKKFLNAYKAVVQKNNTNKIHYKELKDNVSYFIVTMKKS